MRAFCTWQSHDVSHKHVLFEVNRIVPRGIRERENEKKERDEAKNERGGKHCEGKEISTISEYILPTFKKNV